MSNAKRIPAFVNPESGSAEGARDALSGTGLFDIHEIDPSAIREEVKKAIDGGATRVLISGGDGSIRSAASVVAGTDVELAVLPAGTLNHFARDRGIPVDLGEAARVAAGGVIEPVDAGFVGDKLFLNTSSIGAYVSFMRVRERFERHLGYRVASFLALIRTFLYMRPIIVELEVEGTTRMYRTPLVFIGVDERELQVPTLGNRVEGGRSGLHVMVVSGRARARLLLLAWEAMSKGVKNAARAPELDSFIVDRCVVSTRRSVMSIALDGEEERVTTPLEYRIERDILKIVRGAK